MSSWAPVSRGYNWQWRHKDVDYCLSSDSIDFLTEASHKFNSWPSILTLEGNTMLSEARRHLSWNSLHWVQHSDVEV